MKKFISVLLVLPLLCGVLVLQSYAADTFTVYVTIANGSLLLTELPVNVTDADGDGALTINDALYLAHEARFDGGAAAGYTYAAGDYGLYIAKLWGVENGSGYGICVNDAFTSGISDTVKSGDFIYAYVFTDTVGFSDTYGYFDIKATAETEGGQLSLTLSHLGFDENWNTVMLAVEGAEVSLNGVGTGVKTDAAGKATVNVPEAGTYVVSATTDALTLVPPVCVLTSTASHSPATGDCRLTVVLLLAAVSAAALTVFTCRRLAE